jgi:hypothetical protein
VGNATVLHQQGTMKGERRTSTSPPRCICYPPTWRTRYYSPRITYDGLNKPSESRVFSLCAGFLTCSSTTVLSCSGAASFATIRSVLPPSSQVPKSGSWGGSSIFCQNYFSNSEQWNESDTVLNRTLNHFFRSVNKFCYLSI